MEDAEYRRLGAAWGAGETVHGIKFKYNVLVQVKDEEGKLARGWIVGVEPADPEPIYTVEIENGNPCVEMPESAIELINETE